MGTAKRSVVLLGMLTVLLTTAVPAFAQETPQYGVEDVSATGVIFDGLPQDVGDSAPTRSRTRRRARSTLSGARAQTSTPTSDSGRRSTVR
jgi:hypothetical protein